MELKSCPFCNGEARYSTIRMRDVPSGDKGYLTEIYCHKCKKGVKIWALKKDWSIKNAIEAWNKRIADGTERKID